RTGTVLTRAEGGRYRGHAVVRDGRIHGWALDQEKTDQPLLVEVTVDGERLGEFLAQGWRSDLDKRFGSGNHGFVIERRDRPVAGDSHVLVRHAASGEIIAELNAPLPRSLAPHEPISPPDRRDRRRSLAEKAGPGDAVVAVRPGMGSEVILADTTAEDLPPTGSVLRPALIGIGAVAIFFIGFGSWAATSSLDRAVVASGQVTVERGR